MEQAMHNLSAKECYHTLFYFLEDAFNRISQAYKLDTADKKMLARSLGNHALAADQDTFIGAFNYSLENFGEQYTQGAFYHWDGSNDFKDLSQKETDRVYQLANKGVFNVLVESEEQYFVLSENIFEFLQRGETNE